jgi:predicted enzyme related to lactoylglutathione lyase
MPNPVVHFEIITEDPQSLGRFYREAFGWDVDTAHPGSGAGGVATYFLARPNGDQPPSAGINGGIGGLAPGYGGHVTFYIGVTDVGVALAKALELGATRTMGPEQVPGGPVIALFSDPQGHTVGLVEIPQ